MKVQQINAIDKMKTTTGLVALHYDPFIHYAESIEQYLNKHSLGHRVEWQFA
jgi:hypothetical protein